VDRIRNEGENPSDLGLQKPAQKFRQLADWIPVSIAIFDLDMHYLDLSQGWRDDCQIGDRNVIGLSHYEVFPDLPERWKDVHRRCLAGATERNESDAFLRPDGTSGWIRWEVRPWRDDSGNIGGIVIWDEDITARKQAELFVQQEGERRYRAAVANSQVTVWEQDLQLRYTWLYNPKLGYAVNEVIGKTDAELMDSTHAKELESLKRRVLETGQSIREDVAAGRYQRVGYYDLSIDPIHDASGQIVGISCAATDITERRQVGEALRILVSEKEGLLKEVHHRVKNNLQVITSLLRLESRRSAVANTKAVLDDMQARIRTMALLHESLYRSGTHASVDLGSYLRELSTQAFETQSMNSGAVLLKLNLGSLQVSMDQAIPIGLLTNELISNSLKHGFPEGATGQISIDLQPLDTANQWRVRVSDTGVGLPENFEEKRKNSLGLALVTDLARQIGGELSIQPNQDKGVAFSLDFQALEPAPLLSPA
jgi:PAS domain S-box-containing protein